MGKRRKNNCILEEYDSKKLPLKKRILINKENKDLNVLASMDQAESNAEDSELSEDEDLLFDLKRAGITVVKKSAKSPKGSSKNKKKATLSSPTRKVSSPSKNEIRTPKRKKEISKLHSKSPRSISKKLKTKKFNEEEEDSDDDTDEDDELLHDLNRIGIVEMPSPRKKKVTPSKTKTDNSQLAEINCKSRSNRHSGNDKTESPKKESKKTWSSTPVTELSIKIKKLVEVSSPNETSKTEKSSPFLEIVSKSPKRTSRSSLKTSGTPKTATSSKKSERRVSFSYDFEDDDDDFEPKKTPLKSVTPRGSKTTPRRSTLKDSTPKRVTPRRKSGAFAKEMISMIIEEEVSPDKTPNTPRSSKRISAVTREVDSPLKNKIGTPRSSKREIAGESGSKKPQTPRSCKKSLVDEENYSPVKTPQTPRSSKRVSVRSRNDMLNECVTPKQNKQNQALPQTPKTPLEKARLSLHLASVPKALPCREKEYQNIYNFLSAKLLDEVGGCMYISGVPGTGKTATVSQVIRELKETDDIPKFQFIELNGMRLSDPRQAYCQLWQSISGKIVRISSDSAQKNLENWFSKYDKKKINTVLLIDELDLMCTRKQDVVYNLLDWPTRTHSRLVVLAIANTMDMPERLLKGRVTSRMGLTRLTFYPYTYKQLEEIITMRLKDLNAFTSDAVQLVTRKVAAVSGDARRALDICRRATEIPGSDEIVNVAHIELAIKEMCNSNIIKTIRCLSEMEKMFLRSMADECRRTGCEEVDLINAISDMSARCTLEGLPKIPVISILCICNRLRACHLLYSNDAKSGILQRLTLNVSQDDIYFAFKD